MNEVTKTKRWHTVGTWFPRLPRAVIAGASLCVAACATHPVVHVTEVPIDQFSATGPATPTAGEVAVAGAPTAEVAAPEAASAPAPAGGPASPTPINTTPASNDNGAGIPPPPFPAVGAHARPAHALRITATTCSQLIDRYVILFGVSQGLTMAQATKALPGMKAQVQNDATVAATSACVDQTSKKQSQCAMKATTIDAWKTCVE